MSDSPSTSPTSTVRSITPEDLKVKLRKTKTVPGKVKAVVYKNCLQAPAGTMQFGSDVSVYGLYEALLFVENMEADGVFAPGTAVAAIKTLIK